MRRPLWLLFLIVAVSLVLATALVASARPGSLIPRPMSARAVPDSDTVAVEGSLPADSPPPSASLAASDSLDTAADTLTAASDTLAAPADSLAASDTLDLRRSFYYFPGSRRDRHAASPLQRRRRALSPNLGAYWNHEVALDSTGNTYVARETVGGHDVRFPLQMDLKTYRRIRLREDMHEGWRTLAERQSQRARGTNNPFGFNIVIPGGRESAFSTIFGKNEVDLRVSGQADINAGFDYRKSEQQAAVFGQAGQVDPLFKQDLRLGIQGTIGDKLHVDVSWDTQSQFDYQNQLRLRYEGYEDEIIQRVEAGNVMLQTPSTLIRGGQSLFGIKSEMQLGGVRLTTVASQQEGQSNNLSISGGSETKEFEIRPTQYDESTHFFLGYYFRNRWEPALANPPTLTVSHGFDGIKDIEVWRIVQRSPEDEDVRRGVAVVDLGESPEILGLANAYTEQVVPDQRLDQYDEASGEVDDQLRFNEQPAEYLRAKGLSDADFQTGWFKKLIENRDYRLDDKLGFITLNSRLESNEALAVSYKLVAGGQQLQVGDFSTETGGSSGGRNEQQLVLKLIRPVELAQPQPETGFNPAAWYLEMRNIYRLGGGLQPTDFDLQIYYEPPGKTPSKAVVDIGGTRTLLQLLGLDRLNVNDARQPDDKFDFLPGFTIIPSSGLLVFPFLEPFGRRIEELVVESGGDLEEAHRLYVFDRLYTQKKTTAQKDTQKDVYRIRASSRGSAQDFYELGGYAGLIEGSVRVTSGGRPLQEGTDYLVDYTAGSVRITNPAYLSSGRDINITWEQNQFISLQKKTLIGMRADYGDLQDPLKLGATMMRLNQKSPIDKFRLGEEPVSNTIWGVDGRLDLQPRWLTRAVDVLPLIQTKEPSRIEISGEFAQLRPSHVETNAFQRSRRELRDRGRDFYGDELRGVSYIDDFEGFENTYSLKQPGSWTLSAPPDSVGAVDPLPGDPLLHNTEHFDSLRTNWKASFGWYTISAQILQELPAVGNLAAVSPVHINDVYPNRDTRGETGDRSLQTLDFYFNPRERGPYNYTRDLAGFFLNPKNAWGGMTQRIPQGYTDFDDRNVEFVEFVIRPFAENEANDAGLDGKLYLDLGEISEDIIPNQEFNSEDGLSLNSASPADLDQWSRIPRGNPDGVITVNSETRRTEDVGLDGLASYDEPSSAYPDAAREVIVHREFLEALDPSAIDDAYYRAEVEKARFDPSGDDFFFFGDDSFFGRNDLFPNGARVQQRFSRYFPSTELNSYEAQRELGSGRSGNSRYPDSEDLNLNTDVDTRNSYFQFEVPLGRQALDADADRPGTGDGDFVVTEIQGLDGAGTGWYQVRIPVREYTRRVGNPDFSQVKSIRIWTTGHEVPITVRFAELELVGSQWQKSRAVAEENGDFVDADSSALITISSIDNEANVGEYQIPDGTVVSQLRLPTGGVQLAREQSMVLRVQDLRPGQQRAVFKPLSQGLDLLKYEHVRMFVHMHGRTADGVDLTSIPKEEARQKARLFIRFGANETNDYYEYEQPLTPSLTTSASSDELWQTRQPWEGQVIDLNSVNIRLGALNQLKFERDTRGFVPDSVFWNVIQTSNGPVQQGPDISDTAPPGTRIGIRGNPSLGKVTSIVIGIRNGLEEDLFYSSSEVLEDINVWVNELRASGYDETNGWAGVMNADVKLADLARVRANVSAQTDGFGSLSSTLDEREQNNIMNWGLTSELYVDKFIPERYGWSLPLNVQYQSNSSTPRFSPSRGDVRLDEILAQIDERTDLDEAEKERLKSEAVESAQTLSVSRSITARVSKRASRSKLLRNTLDNLLLSYSFSDAAASNPSQRQNDSWRWSASAGYTFRMKPRTIRPFWFAGGIPVLGFLGDLRFNYAPQNVGFNGSANRSFQESQERSRDVAADTLPAMVQYPVRQGQIFGHRRTFDLQYNPFTFLNLTFNTGTTQNLNAAGVDTLYTMVIRDPESGLYVSHPGLSQRAALDQGLILPEDVNRRAFEVREIGVAPTDRVLSRILAGEASPRTEQYQQGFQATFQPRFTQYKKLNWFSITPISYNVTFSWANGPVGRFTGANVSNRLELRGGINLRPQEFWRLFGFYRSLEEAQRTADAEKQQRKRERAAERERRREQNRRDEDRRLQEAQQRAAAAADTTGETPALPPADAKAAVSDAARDTTATADADTSGSGFKLPLPNPIPLLRRTALAITGLRDVSLTYSRTARGTSSNVADFGRQRSSYSLIDALRGDGPSIGYRFGFSNQIPIHQRLLTEGLVVSDAITVDHRVQGRTMISPSQSLQITLNWNTDWGLNENITFNSMTDFTRTEGGTTSSSVWAFGASYPELFRRQLETYRSDEARASGDKLAFGDADADGRVVLTNHSVTEDFQNTFLTGFGLMDSRGLLPFPMPTWNVNYTGISNWPIIRSLVESATLKHGYSARYSTDYRTNLASAGADSMDFDLAGRRISFRIPEFDVGAIRISEQYTPFVGVSLTWKGRIQTDISWNKNNSYSMSTSNFELGESKTNQFDLTGSYFRQGMRIPFLGKVENRITFSLTVGYSETSDVRYPLKTALRGAISDPEFDPSQLLTNDDYISVLSQITRYTATPRIAYQFSQKLQADFSLRYERLIGDSRQPSFSSLSGQFNVRVSIAN